MPFSVCFTYGKSGGFDILGKVPSNSMKMLFACKVFRAGETWVVQAVSSMG